MTSVTRFLIGLCLLALMPVASAQDYPNKPITLVVPYATGSVNDSIARIFGAKLSEILKVPVVVDDKPGANTIVAANAVAKAAPNGYTLLVTTAATTVQNPLLYRKLSYTPEDFVPISGITRDGNMCMVINPSIPAKTVKEFVEYAKGKGGQLSYASIGMGSTHHVYMELLKQRYGIEMIHVPYKASPVAEQDVMRGEIAVMFTGIGTAPPQHKSGQLRILAVTGTRQVPTIPDVPTMGEAGYPGFEATSWVGVFAPAKTPQAIVDALSEASVRALQSDEVRDKLTNIGAFPLGSSHQEFAASLKRDKALWTKVFADSKVPLMDE